MAKKKRRAGRKPRPPAKAKTSVEDTASAEATSADGSEPSGDGGSAADDAEVRASQEESAASESELEPSQTGSDDVSPEDDDSGGGSPADTEAEPSSDEIVAGVDEPDETNPDGADEAAEEGETADSEAEEDSVERAGDDSEKPEEEDGAGLVGEGVEIDESEVEDTEHYLKGLVEAILFSSDKPQTAREVARAARLDKGRVQELVEQLIVETKDRGVRLVEVSEGYAFRTNPAYSSYVREFLAQRPVRLSRAQLETLAIVAYRQPITRPEVDDIRGVDSGAVIKLLLERELIRILGKKDEPGRPMIYGTAPAFLDLFSLNSLRDLPTLREFTELSEDSRAKFELEIGEPAPEGPIDLSEEDEASEPSESAGEASESAGEASEGSEDASGADEAPETDLGDAPDREEGLPSDDADADDADADDAETDDADADSDSSDTDAEPREEPRLNPADEEEFPDDEDEDDEDEDDDDDDDED